MLRVLLTEDNLVNQKLAMRLLEKRGHSVVIARNGREAVEALHQQPFDVVLMDVQMPEMDGFEATQIIRARERDIGGHVPIVAMTAHAMKGDRERCLEVGMDGYISKPLHPTELFEAVESLAVASVTEERPQPVSQRTSSKHSFDRAVVLSNVGGDLGLMKELIQIFFEDYPQELDKARQAIATQNAEALKHSAHSLKGAIGAFGAAPAREAAQRLETMGREGNLHGAEETFAELEEALARLQTSLEDLAKEHVPKP